MIYAGIGSRETPVEIQAQMKLIGSLLGTKGFTLRSGGAKGADTAFEQGCNAVNGAKIIRTPSPGGLIDGKRIWMEHAASFHPAWGNCDRYAQECHARNSAIMLGDYLDTPANLVVCWTVDGAAVGGTGQALRIAEANSIPVFNLWWPEHFSALMTWIGSL